MSDSEPECFCCAAPPPLPAGMTPLEGEFFRGAIHMIGAAHSGLQPTDKLCARHADMMRRAMAVGRQVFGVPS